MIRVIHIITRATFPTDKRGTGEPPQRPPVRLPRGEAGNGLGSAIRLPQTRTMRMAAHRPAGMRRAHRWRQHVW